MNNRILANGGTNLAGGIGIFAGTDDYVVRGNDICGNFSAEYGGGLSRLRLQPERLDRPQPDLLQPVVRRRRRDHDRRPAADRSSILSPGAGATSIHDNLIQQNLANDDGGGLRFLMASSTATRRTDLPSCPINVYNNMIVNNVSTHEGGGIALDDTPNVRIDNNTIMKNVTTATAVTSNGQPAPAGLSTGRQQRPAAGEAEHDRGRGDLQQPAPVQQHLLGQPGRARAWPAPWSASAPTATRPRSTTGTRHCRWLRPARSDELDRPAERGRPSLHDERDQLGGQPGRGRPVRRVARVRSVADEPELPRLDRRRPGPATEASRRLPPDRSGHVGFRLQHRRGEQGRPELPAAAVDPRAPTTDIDGHPRPARGGFDIGADEIPPPFANLSITKTDGVTTVQPGGSLTYTIASATPVRAPSPRARSRHLPGRP